MKDEKRRKSPSSVEEGKRVIMQSTGLLCESSDDEGSQGLGK